MPPSRRRNDTEITFAHIPQAVSRARRQLTEALELVDEAIHILRSYVRENPDKAEKLEDILYTLEEAGEALDELVSAEEREGHR